MFTSGHHYNLSEGVRIPVASIPTSQNRANNAAEKVAGNLHCAAARQGLLYGIIHLVKTFQVFEDRTPIQTRHRLGRHLSVPVSSRITIKGCLVLER